MLSRDQKALRINELTDRFEKCKAAFLVDYKGMNVEQMVDLRKKLLPLQGEIKVVRNTLVKRALQKFPKEEKALSEKFLGTNALVFSYDDPSGVAKALEDFGKEVEHLKLKSGVMDGGELSAANIKQLAKLPSKEVLRAQLLGTFMAPASQFVRVLNAVPAGFLNVMNAYKDKKES